MNAQLLKRIDVFAGVDDDYLRTLAAFVGEISVPEGAAIVKEGHCAYEFFAIVEGTAEVQRDGQAIATLEAGACFGEIGMFGDRPRTATVVATTPMWLITMTRWDLKRVSRDVLFEIRRQLNERLVAQAD